jgi:hypothetical protein
LACTFESNCIVYSLCLFENVSLKQWSKLVIIYLEKRHIPENEILSYK